MKKKLLRTFGLLLLLGIVFWQTEVPVWAKERTEQISYSKSLEQKPCWPQVKALLESLLTDEVHVEVYGQSSWSGADREMEHPAKYIFAVYLYENDFSYDFYKDVLDRYLVVLDHCIEMDGNFTFYIWVEEDGDEDVIKTDFQQQLFSYVLAKTSHERALEKQNGFLIGNSPSESNYAIPYYELMEEPIVLETMGREDNAKVVFQRSYEKMHDWQEQIEGDLTLAVRFCDDFNPEDTERYIDPGKPQESLNSQELTNWVALMEVQGYRYWLDKYGAYFPEHELSFHSDYGEEQEAFYEMLLSERRNYLTGQKGSGEAKKSTYTVQEGDTLWRIAVQFFGDGKRYVEIWQENREVIGEDMNYILPGQVLHLPDIVS
ncbi:MAG: LysM peptidoglycan-binding domain-containing protein [Acetatifactor sp.]|nr:LysM peptidoglycan-binding domain-containing protein [Acetatifactor sp.]